MTLLDSVWLANQLGEGLVGSGVGLLVGDFVVKAKKKSFVLCLFFSYQKAYYRNRACPQEGHQVHAPQNHRQHTE